MLKNAIVMQKYTLERFIQPKTVYCFYNFGTLLFQLKGNLDSLDILQKAL